MSAPTEADLYYDPYNIDLNMNPFPVFARIREEAPLYYNEQHDFYALSRYDDVNRGVVDHERDPTMRVHALQLGTLLLVLGAGCGSGNSFPSQPFVVNTLEDLVDPPAGTVSLRSALAQADPSQRITFDPALLKSKLRPRS